VLAVSLAGCGPKVVEYQVRVVTSACVAPSPLEGVTHLRFRVTGPGLEAPLESASRIEEAVQRIPKIPAGPQRVLQVRGYAGDPATGMVLSLGVSSPFDVPQVVPEGAAPVEIAVFLRRVNAFTPPSTLQAPTTCSRLTSGRAGHTATLLDDGRVLVAGGYHLGAERARDTQHTGELFDPTTGAFSAAADVGLFNQQGQFTAIPRAFHGAVRLANGQVLLAGGERRSGGSYFANKTGLVYDPAVNKFWGFEMKAGRIGPGLAADEAGRVLVVGGVDSQGKAVAAPEWLDPAKPAFTAQNPDDPSQASRENPRLLADAAPRVGMSVAPVQDGKFIAVAGGANGTEPADEVLFFRFDGDTFRSEPSTVRLRQTRHGAGLARFGDSNRLVIIGGFQEPASTGSSLDSSEIISTGGSFNVADGQPITASRGDLCVASLPDGRVLAVGGRTGAGNALQSVKNAELMAPNPAGGAQLLEVPPLAVSRYHHTCTTLRDGSVLILGGVEEAPSGPRVLSDAWIYTPAPTD
jgi:hypothetical protein